MCTPRESTNTISLTCPNQCWASYSEKVINYLKINYYVTLKKNV